MKTSTNDPLPFTAPDAIASGGKESGDVFIVSITGNSITRHATNEELFARLGWNRECGMAASCEEKDYVHLLLDMLRAALPERDIRLSLNIIDPQSDLIIFQGGEHAALPEMIDEFRITLDKQLADYREITPAVVVIGIWNPLCRNEFLHCTAPKYAFYARQIELIQRDLCRKHHIQFAAVSSWENDPANTGSGAVAAVRWHPNDRGMQCYAEAAFTAVKALPQWKIWQQTEKKNSL